MAGKNLSEENVGYWQKYKPGEIPSVPVSPPQRLIEKVRGPILDVGTGDGLLAEDLAKAGKKVMAIDVAANIIAEDQKRDSSVEYSVQNIVDGTNFPDKHFDLIIFKFVLTNIHKESWESLGKEVERILKPGGRVWILEPLVSESYNERYELATKLMGGNHCVYVFKDKDQAAKVKTVEEMRKALEADQVSRVIKHYTVDELKSVFGQLSLDSSREISVVSPSGYMINTFEGVFRKSEN